jgi:hypothetical protein
LLAAASELEPFRPGPGWDAGDGGGPNKTEARLPAPPRPAIALPKTVKSMNAVNRRAGALAGTSRSIPWPVSTPGGVVGGGGGAPAEPLEGDACCTAKLPGAPAPRAEDRAGLVALVGLGGEASTGAGGAVTWTAGGGVGDTGGGGGGKVGGDGGGDGGGGGGSTGVVGRVGTVTETVGSVTPGSPPAAKAAAAEKPAMIAQPRPRTTTACRFPPTCAFCPLPRAIETR